MTDHRAALAPHATDARFLTALRGVVALVVDDTAEGRNGELWIERFTRDSWFDEQIDAALRGLGSGPVPAMLAARTRLGENVRLIEDIDLEKVRAGLDDSDKADKIDALLDFVAEIRTIAKEI